MRFCEPGFSIDLNFQDVMTSKLKNLDVSVHCKIWKSCSRPTRKLKQTSTAGTMDAGKMVAPAWWRQHGGAIW